LAMTFQAIGKEMDLVWKVRMVINILCLFLVVFISAWIGRGILRSLNELATGLDRFGKGDFTQPVQVIGNDELSEVADRANQMAEKINSLVKELASFSYSVAHDLRAPIRSIVGFSNILLEDFSEGLPAEGKNHLARVTGSAKKMGELIDSLLNLSRLNRKELSRGKVDLSALAEAVLNEIQESRPANKISRTIAKGIVAQGDAQLLQIVFVNLFGNAAKFSAKKPQTEIEFGTDLKQGKTCFFVRDHGAGFDMRYADKLFGTFQRLHSNAEFEGTGIGLATVQSIIHRHGGKIWAESKVDYGTTFYFTLG
jgi:light-regulated signal transduction histidine kinase (bacteriophytochrome)